MKLQGSSVMSNVFCFEYEVESYTLALNSFMHDIRMKKMIILPFYIVNKISNFKFLSTNK